MTERAIKPAPLRPDEQDAALRSKLAFNDRPLRSLIKKMSQVVGANGEAEVAQAITSFRLDLETYFLQLRRVEAVAHKTTVSEVQAYQEKAAAMDQEKIDTLESIEMLKKELVEVQQDRKNKLEYDALASDIMKFGTREELDNQLTSLRTTLHSLSEESQKYTEIMTQSKSRFEGIADQLKQLRADVGFEVGERERREVEREGEGDAEEEARAGEEAVEAATAAVTNAKERAAAAVEGEHGEGQSRIGRSSLNPSAPVFRPSSTSRESSPGHHGGSSSSTTGKRRRSTRKAAGDEEEEDADPSKKRAREEGEMSEGEVDEEEEEGAA